MLIRVKEVNVKSSFGLLISLLQDTEVRYDTQVPLTESLDRIFQK